MAPLQDLNERQRGVLFYIVDTYIQRGEAVASATIARESQLDVSSATIRNVMGDLEAMGLLAQPHTSAGRVPTALGLRQWVDEIALKSHAAPISIGLAELSDESDLESNASRAGAILSQLTNFAGLVLGPQLSQVRLRDLKLVSISDHRILAILVTEEGRVIERMCHLDEPLDLLALNQMQNYLVEYVTGQTLNQMRLRIRDELKMARSAKRQFEESALRVGEQVASSNEETKLRVEGLTKFLDIAELTSDMDRLREVVRVVEERERLIEILDRIESATGPSVAIGTELEESDWARDLGLVVCRFYQGPEPVGMIGVLGPMRMDYQRIIPLVERVAGVLNTARDDDSNQN